MPGGEEYGTEGQLPELVTEAELDKVVRLLYLERSGRNVAAGSDALTIINMVASSIVCPQ